MQGLAFAGFVCAAAWPLTNFMAVNYSQIAAGAYGRPDILYLVTGAAILVGVLLGFLVSRIRPRAGARVLAVLAVGVFLLFNSVALREVLRSIGLSAYGTIATTVVMGLALVVVWLLSKAEPIRVLISLASIIVVAMALTGLVPQVFASWSAGATDVVEEISADARALSGENVYLIVLDEYAGESSLAGLGVDSRPFIEEMISRGFRYDADAKSNYVTTYISVMAMLEADYPVTEESERYSDRSGFYPAAINNGHAPQLVRSLSSSGYSTQRISNWWAGCSAEVFDLCIESGSSVQSYALRTFLQPTIVEPVASRLLPKVGNQGDTALELFQEQYFELQQEEPYFLLIHHMAPHQPYSRNADCSVRDVPDSDASLPRPDRAPFYIAATQCVNIEVLKAVDLIEQHDPTGIVVILSDHGSDFQVDWELPLNGWSERALLERLNIMSLVKLPEECERWAKNGMGQINVARLTLGCLSRTQPEYLPEHSYISAYENHPEFGLVARVR